MPEARQALQQGAAPAPDRYAVVGNPVAHSLSPEIHARFAEQTSQHLVYERLLIPAGQFKATVEGFFASGGKGLNVTVPCKGDAFTWVGEEGLDPLAKRARAVNTIAKTAMGFTGHNTDGIGLVRDLQWHCVNISNARVLVLGAGGAVRGIIPALMDAGIKSLFIANRTASTARQLAEDITQEADLNCEGGSLPEVDGQFDLVINGTSAGLSEQALEMPASLIRDAWCYDLMYGPKAAFHHWAKTQTQRGSCDGLGMLIEQAAEAFFVWRGVRPDTAPVRAQLTQEAR